MTTASAANPELIYSLRRVSESAALAAFDWIGRGDGMDGGRAALEEFTELRWITVQSGTRPFPF